jgi:hypothetical protein
MLENDYYLKEVGDEHLRCQHEPSLSEVRVACTLPEFLLSKQVLECVKWHTTHCLDSMECVHHVGLHMRVLSGPAKA